MSIHRKEKNRYVLQYFSYEGNLYRKFYTAEKPNVIRFERVHGMRMRYEPITEDEYNRKMQMYLQTKPQLIMN